MFGPPNSAEVKEALRRILEICARLGIPIAGQKTGGCGAFSSAGEWFQIEWLEKWKEFHITVKELLPIVMGVALWGNGQGDQ